MRLTPIVLRHREELCPHTSPIPARCALTMLTLEQARRGCEQLSAMVHVAGPSTSGRHHGPSGVVLGRELTTPAIGRRVGCGAHGGIRAVQVQVCGL
jgi:hypothetical protein